MKIIVRSLCAVFLLIVACHTENSHKNKVEKGAFRATLVETGELQAVNSKIIPMPAFSWSYGRPKIIELEKEGLIVKKGDIVGKIETAGVESKLSEEESELAMAQADLKKLDVEHASQLKNLSAELESAKAGLRQAIIDTQRVTFESAVKKKIQRLKYQRAVIALSAAENKLKHKKIVQREEILIQKAKIKKIVADIDQAHRTIERFILHAPADGMIEYRRKRWGSREKIKVGDESWPGETFNWGFRISGRMKALTTINETDIDKVDVGNKVTVKLDAFPKYTFDGSVIWISKTCRKKESKSKVKVFDVEVILDGSDPILRPGMTVSCEIVIADLADALWVNFDCIHQEGKDYYIYVQNDGKTNRVKVTLGPRNSKAVVVYGELDAGDKIVSPQKSGKA